MLHTRVMPSADCYTDHRLVRAKVNFRIKVTPRKKGLPPKKLQVERLHLLKEEFQAKLKRKLDVAQDPSTDDPEELWNHRKTTLQETTAEVVGFSRRRNKDWFDESDSEIKSLLQAKHICHGKVLACPTSSAAKSAYREACKQLQVKLRVIQNNWWTALAERTQLYADMGDTRSFYEALKSAYGPSHQAQTPLKTSDGSTLLTDKKAIMKRWAEHFNCLFEDRRIFQDTSIARIPQHESRSELDIPPTLKEVASAICKLRSHKSPGSDGIPAEVYKQGGDALLYRLTDLFAVCWEKGTIPEDFRDALIVSLYKNKGEKSDCSNYRGISLLSTAGKILARVLLDRITSTVAEEVLPESQCGFRSGRGTTDMVFVLRQIQEKCREQNMGLYAAFIDLTKAFDTVSREGLWKIMFKLGCPPKFLTILQQLHVGQKGQVKHTGSISEPFPINNGVKQGCVLAPTLFAIFFSMMLQEATADVTEGLYIRYRTDGGIFNLRRLLAKTKTTDKNITELLFADDCALLAHTEEALQLIVSRFSAATKAYGLTISLKKTEVLYQPPPRVQYIPPSITIDTTCLSAVDQFTYLGSVISNDASITKDIDNRLSKANSAFDRLHKRVWDNHSLRLTTKIQVYRAAVLSTLLYGSESWVLYRKQLRLLECFHQRCLRSILNIRWQDHTTNMEVLERAQLPSMEATVLVRQLRWSGHVSRMEENRLPKAVLYSELRQGKRDRSGPRKRFKNQLKYQLTMAGLESKTWESTAADKNAWRSAVNKAAVMLSNTKRTAEMHKRARRKGGASIQTATTATGQEYKCTSCQKICWSRIGLFSHQRACLKAKQKELKL